MSFINQSCAGECTSQISLESTYADTNFSADDVLMGRKYNEEAAALLVRGEANK
jgi:hypothetical protein